MSKTAPETSVKKQGSIKKQSTTKNGVGPSPERDKNLALRATPLEPAQTISHYTNKNPAKKQLVKPSKITHDDSEADFVLGEDKKASHSFLAAGSNSGSLDRNRAERIGNDAYKNLLQVRSASPDPQQHKDALAREPQSQPGATAGTHDPHEQ